MVSMKESVFPVPNIHVIHRLHSLNRLAVLFAGFGVRSTLNFNHIEAIPWPFIGKIFNAIKLVWDKVAGKGFASAGVFESHSVPQLSLSTFQHLPALDVILIV
jgi:hypothetical protein